MCINNKYAEHRKTYTEEISGFHMTKIKGHNIIFWHCYWIIFFNVSTHQVSRTLRKRKISCVAFLLINFDFFLFSVSCFNILFSLGKSLFFVFVFVEIFTHQWTFTGNKVPVPFPVCIVLKRSGSKCIITNTVFLVSIEMGVTYLTNDIQYNV